MKYFAWIFCLALLVSCSKTKKAEAPKAEAPAASAPAAPAEEPLKLVPPDQMLSPLESIKDLDRKIESYKTGASLSAEENRKNQQLKQGILRGTFDIAELSRMALDAHWEKLTPAEQQKFIGLMTNLLERKAIFSKEQVKGGEKAYQVSYKEQKFIGAEKERAQVSTVLFVPLEKIDLNINYELKKTPYGWRIYDVIVDDASLVDNYKFQFNTIITKYGYPDLVSRMEKKLKEME